MSDVVSTNVKSPSVKKQRLLSLDILRGADLALLVLIQPVLFVWLEKLNPSADSFWGFVFTQIEHVPWQGFCFWDIIMPLFMFMSGVSIPFAMAEFKDNMQQKWPLFLRRVLKRFVVLWILGMFCQGNLLDFDIHTLKFFSNTLQSIAVGYVVVACLYVISSLRTQLIIVGLLFMAYIAIFAIWGNMDFTIGTNICQQIDNSVLGSFRDGVNWQGDRWAFDPNYNYTWIMSSLNFVVTVFFGNLTGYMLKSGQASPQKALRIWMLGVMLIAAGLLMGYWIPIVKHIWSSSMTLLSGGICIVLMAAFYYFIDVKGWKTGTQWLVYYGTNSLAAYLMIHVPLNSIVDCFFHGFAQWLGVYYIVLQTAVQVAVIFLILKWMYKHRIFIKA